MTHDDGRSFELLDGNREVVNDLRHCQVGDQFRVLAQRLYFDLKAWVAGRHHGETLRLVVLHPAFPASRRHPKPVNQDYGVGRSCLRHVTLQRLEVE